MHLQLANVSALAAARWFPARFDACMSLFGESSNLASAAAERAVEEPTWRCGIAGTRRERESAFRLIYEAYTRAGLGQPNDAGMRVTPYHLLPTTTIFIATLDSGPEAGTVFSTVSLVIDGAFGLPLERVYDTEVHRRRNEGLRLAEVSCLADRRLDLRRFFPVFVALNRWMIQFAQAQAVDQVLVAVHPKHARFYTRNLGFEAIGGLTSYPTANNRPAVALSFNFHRNHRDTCAYYQHFFHDPIAPQLLQPMPMSEAEMRYFGPMVDPAFTCELPSHSVA
jgi:hypothetical protein